MARQTEENIVREYMRVSRYIRGSHKFEKVLWRIKEY
jgi:hypothetical protein